MSRRAQPSLLDNKRDDHILMADPRAHDNPFARLHPTSSLRPVVHFIPRLRNIGRQEEANFNDIAELGRLILFLHLYQIYARAQ